jgi:hypothetical protein
MPTITELFAGRTETIAEKSSVEIHYVVTEAASESDVRAAALSGTPLFYYGLPRKSVELSERINETTWKVAVRYEKADSEPPPETPEPVTSFDSTGGTQHITQSIATVGRYGEKASDQLGGAIGYDGENVNGVDITIPVWNWTETHYLPVINSAAYYSLTGKVNADVFRGFQPGEVLFLGASGTQRGDGLWEITFKFAASPNRDNIAVGSITGIAKKGWEYLWVQYGDDVDDTVKTRIKKPIAVYVERVYDEGNLASLGI